MVQVAPPWARVAGVQIPVGMSIVKSLNFLARVFFLKNYTHFCAFLLRAAAARLSSLGPSRVGVRRTCDVIIFASFYHVVIVIARWPGPVVQVQVIIQSDLSYHDAC